MRVRSLQPQCVAAVCGSMHGCCCCCSWGAHYCRNCIDQQNSTQRFATPSLTPSPLLSLPPNPTSHLVSYIAWVKGHRWTSTNTQFPQRPEKPLLQSKSTAKNNIPASRKLAQAAARRQRQRALPRRHRVCRRRQHPAVRNDDRPQRLAVLPAHIVGALVPDESREAVQLLRADVWLEAGDLQTQHSTAQYEWCRDKSSGKPSRQLSHSFHPVSHNPNAYPRPTSPAHLCQLSHNIHA